MHYYSLFGKIVESELEFANLITATPTDNPDYTITIGKTPETINGKQIGISAYANQNELLLKIKNIVNFYCKDNHITVEKQPNTDNQDIKAFLLDTVFAYLLNKEQKYLILHGTALLINNKATLIISRPSNGKSTLGYSLHKYYDYPILSDGLLVLEQSKDTKSIQLINSGTPMSLWEYSCKQLEVDFSTMLRVRNSILRYELPLLENAAQSNNNIVIASKAKQSNHHVNNIIQLRTHLANEPEIKECKGTDKIDAIVDVIPHYPITEITNNIKNGFKLGVKLASKSKVFEITRPEKYPFQEFTNLVNNVLTTNNQAHNHVIASNAKQSPIISNKNL